MREWAWFGISFLEIVREVEWSVAMGMRIIVSCAEAFGWYEGIL